MSTLTNGIYMYIYCLLYWVIYVDSFLTEHIENKYWKDQILHLYFIPLRVTFSAWRRFVRWLFVRWHFVLVTFCRGTINYSTPTHTRCSYTYGLELRLRGTVHLRGTATLTRYSYTNEVQLLLWGKVTPTRTGKIKNTLLNICRWLLNYLLFFN